MKKSYYAIIPADVRYDKRLTDGAKLLYGEITALCNQKGYCWASNSYFAKLYNKNNSTISRWINQLIKCGYIEREIEYKEGTKEVEKRSLQICIGGPLKNEYTPPLKNAIDNNTSTNNTNEYIVEIVSYLNDVAGKNYRHTTRKTQQLIKARMNEGFTVDDFKEVIDKKSKDWKQDKKMNRYLRPETLFGTKFEGYLNENVVPENKTKDEQIKHVDSDAFMEYMRGG